MSGWSGWLQAARLPVVRPFGMPIAEPAAAPPPCCSSARAHAGPPATGAPGCGCARSKWTGRAAPALRACSSRSRPGSTHTGSSPPATRGRQRVPGALAAAHAVPSAGKQPRSRPTTHHPATHWLCGRCGSGSGGASSRSPSGVNSSLPVQAQLWISASGSASRMPTSCEGTAGAAGAGVAGGAAAAGLPPAPASLLLAAAGLHGRRRGRLRQAQVAAIASLEGHRP